MIIARAPTRISFSGGGTDLETYYSTFGGAVASAAIDRYIYSVPAPKGVVEVYYWDGCRWMRQRDVDWLRAVMGHLGIEGIRIASLVPPGTGLGGSGSLVVSMIRCKHGRMARAGVAEMASHIEIDLMDMPVGKQDQYAAAFGGLNLIIFTDANVIVSPIAISAEALAKLERRLMLFNLNSPHSSASILAGQRRLTEMGSAKTLTSLHRLKEVAFAIKDTLEGEDLDAFGALLHQAWIWKRDLAPGITNPTIDGYYEAALLAGAVGGKLTGAGGGGFLLLYCLEDRQADVRSVLFRMGLRPMNFGFDFGGAVNDLLHFPQE